MSNRNILNQNINGRNILNIKNKNLLDGNAIKISSRNEIDVNFITNTSEELTFNDNDLFLASSPDGDNIKYLTGLTIKQGTNNSLIAGNNINFTINNNNRVINVKDVITSLTSINGFTFVTNISSSASQFLLKDNSVGGFANGTFLTTNANGLIAPKTEASVITTVQSKILAGANIVRSLGLNGTLTLALSNALINMASVNGYVFNTTTDSTVNQFLLKDTSVGAFASGDLLTINSSNKVDNITTTQLLNNLTVSNGLTKSNNAISISTSPTINIINAGMTLKNLSGNALLKIQAGTSASYSPSVELIQDGEIRTYLKYDKSNNKFYILAPTGVIELLAYGGTGQININNQNVEIKIDNSIKLKVQSTQVDINTDLDMNGNDLVNVVQINADNDATGSITFNGNGTTKIQANTSLKLQSGSNSGSGATDIVVVSTSGVVYSRRIAMNQQPINLYSLSNTDHQISYSASSDGGTGAMNGIIIRGFGNNLPFFRLQETATGSAGLTVADFYKDKIRFLKPLLMSGNLINFQTTNANNLDRENFIQFKEADGMNGILVKAFGINATAPASRKVMFRVECSDPNVSQPIILDVGPRQVEVYKRLSVIKDTSTLDNDSGDIFTVRNTGFTKALIHSTNNACQLAFKTGSINATLNYATGGQFTLVTQNTISLNNAACRVAMQTDNNLVVYTSSGVVKFASNDGQNAHSSRDYKKNINDLVESDSINIIKNINPVSFEYIEKYWDKHDKCNACNCDIRKGFIWEDIKPILPQTARTINMDNLDEPTTKTLDLKMVIPDLTKTVQYLLKEITTLKEELLTQSNLISNLQSQINNI